MPSALEVGVAPDDHIDGGKDPLEGSVRLARAAVPRSGGKIDEDQEVIVAVGIGVAPGSRAKEDDVLGPKRSDQPVDDFAEDRVGLRRDDVGPLRLRARPRRGPPAGRLATRVSRCVRDQVRPSALRRWARRKTTASNLRHPETSAAPPAGLVRPSRTRCGSVVCGGAGPAGAASRTCCGGASGARLGKGGRPAGERRPG